MASQTAPVKSSGTQLIDKKTKADLSKPDKEKRKKYIPETLIKKRRRIATIEGKRKRSKVRAVGVRAAKRKVIFKRAEAYVQEYKEALWLKHHYKRVAKKNNNFYVEPEAKLAFVVRIRGINGIHPKPRKILQLLRLRRINNGVFVKLNGATLQMLRLIEPYITWGYPNLKSVKELIYKRGAAKLRGKRVVISDNSVIEHRLSGYGILCMEDLVHEIFTVGKHFKAANKFLWPFGLNPPKGGWRKIRKHYNEGGDFGLREDKMNDVIRRMN